ncbi:hypothetical protein Lser_V15G18447 [Lactuca serriola]
MSSCSSSGSSCFVDDEELLQFEARCKELRIEKDMLKESSYELIRSLESHAKTLSQNRSNDKKRIQDLERELRNCTQEIDYLQDQVNTRDTEINHMTDYIQILESKLKAKDNLDGIVRSLEQDLKACNLEKLVLLEKLENKEQELHDVALEYECDIESMNLDLMAMENSFLEAKELQEEVVQEHCKMQEMTKNYKLQMHEYELLVSQLKEQLRDEKFKAKEEAEDLAQEMAELRYELTGLLEEEYKRRACIEQRALQRITELEAQIEKERRKSFADVRGLPNA